MAALPVSATLATVVEAFDTPTPDGLLARLHALPVSAAERQRYGAQAWGSHGRLGDGLQKLAGLPDPAERLRFAWRLAWPEWAYMRQRFPDDSPARLATRYPERWLAVLREFAAVRRRREG